MIIKMLAVITLLVLVQVSVAAETFECGKPLGDFAAFIVGGEKTDKGEWPWQVLVS